MPHLLDYHERILKAVDTCLPIDKVMSIADADGFRRRYCRQLRGQGFRHQDRHPGA